MPEEYDMSELRNYLRGQIDMGDSEVFLDEPWSLNAKKPRAVPQPRPVVTPQAVASRSAVAQEVPPAPVRTQEPLSVGPAMAAPSARPVMRKAASAFEAAESLDAFYDSIQNEAVYAKVGDIVRYAGPVNPKLLLLMPNPLPDSGDFFSSEPGAMLVRLFANLNVAENEIGVTYFYKGHAARNIPALLETALRKMLAKELSFIAPQVMVSFGEPLFHQLFGKGKVFNDLAGTDLDFSGVKTCSLVDAVAMSQDKQLKWLTWKVHIPKCTYFKA